MNSTHSPVPREPERLASTCSLRAATFGRLTRCGPRGRGATVLTAFVLSATLGLAASVVFAQEPPTRGNLGTQLDAMKKLDGFLGEWLGEGWFTMGAQRVGITQSVVVRRELQGQLLTMRDRVQRRTEPLAPPGTASFGIVSYDDKAQRFLMRSYFRSQITDLDAQVPKPGVLIGMTTRPDGRLARVTTDVTTDGVWREHAEDSSDGGKSWVKTYEIVMKRLPGS
jgi:hypothetical protein